ALPTIADEPASPVRDDSQGEACPTDRGDCKGFDLYGRSNSYSDSDYGGATQDRKSSTRGCQFLGRRLISWQCKKQTIVATSTTEAEYVAAASCCGQVLWIQNQLLDFGYNFMNTNIYIDNNSAICIVKNHVYHSKTKHLEIIHHFIEDCFEKKLINVDHIYTDENVADLLTKLFDAGRFQYLVCKLFPLLGKLSTVSVLLGFGLTFAGTFKFWGVLRILMISLTLIPMESKDEPASPQRDVSQGEACPTDSGVIADQDKVTIAKSSTLPHDSAPRVTSPAVVEGSMQQAIPELTALCTSPQRQLFELTNKFQAQEVEINRLKERVKRLEKREGLADKSSGDDAPIKGRSMDEKEVATKRISDDSEEMATVLTSMDAAIVLASGVIDVPSGSGSIPTTSTPAESSVPTSSEEVPTACPVFATATVVTPFTRRKGKEVMVEYETPKKQKVQEQIDAQVARELEEQLERKDQRRAEQIARNAEVARIHVEEELQSMIDGLDSNNETIAKYL
nr:putative ribonuclease H-like domain-containing protein [Tanacetum cinerariifolium]